MDTHEQRTDESTPVRDAQRSALIVEDDCIYRKIYANRLLAADPDIKIIEAIDGYSALHRLVDTTPNLVILDLHMPNLDGAAFLDIVKTKEHYRDLPIVVVTSSPDEVFERFRSLRNVYLFRKPLRAVLLDRIIQLTIKPRAKGASARPDRMQSRLDAYVGSDSAAQREFAQIFYNVMPERLAELDLCVAQADYDRLADWCHAMKGSNMVVGSDVIGGLISTLSEGARLRDPDLLKRTASVLAVELRRFVLEMYARFDLEME